MKTKYNMLIRAEIVLSLLLILAVSADAANWPMYGRDFQHTRYATEVANPPLTQGWTPFCAAGPIVSSPVTALGMVFFGARDNKIYALDAYTGTMRWEYATSGWVDCSPAVAGGMIYATSRDGNLYCLDAVTGHLKWKFATGGTDVSSPLVCDGLVYAASGYPNKWVYAVNAYTGILCWKYSATGQYVYSSPVMSGNTIYIGSNDGKYYGFDKASSRSRWTPFSTRGDIYFASPAVYRGLILGPAGGYDRKFYAIDASTGKEKWSRAILSDSNSASYTSSPAVTEQGIIYVGTGYAPGSYENSEYILTALDAVNNGAIVWQTKPPLVPLGTLTELGYACSPAIAGNYIFVGSGDGNLYVINAGNGTIAWQYSLGSQVISSPCISNGWIYAGTLGGKLYAFKAAEIVSLSNPELNATVNGVLEIQGQAIASGVEKYSLFYGCGTEPATWIPVVVDMTDSLESVRTIQKLDTRKLSDGIYTLKLEVKTASGIKLAKSIFRVGNSSIEASVSAANGGTVTAPDGTSISIPGGVMSQDDIVTITEPAGSPNEGFPDNTLPTGIVREIKFGNPATKLNGLATITIPYRDEQITGIEREYLRIYVWKDETRQWKIVNTSEPKTAIHQVTATVSHLSVFRLMAPSPGGDLLSEDLVYVYPNPATGDKITFKYKLGDNADITIDVYNVSGQRIATLSDSGFAGNAEETVWDIEDIASGVYIFKVEAKSRRTGATAKVIKKLAIVH